MADHTLRMSMDYGTKTLSVAYRIVVAGVEPKPEDVNEIEFSIGKTYAPQMIAWLEDGTFHWGYGVIGAFKQGTIQAGDIIEHWKLLLYKDIRLAPIAEEVQQQLGNRKLVDLIAKHLEHIIDDVKEKIKAALVLHMLPETIDKMPVELFLSVPQMWTPPANHTMMTAAKKAGLSKVDLVYEPQCAAATFAVKAKDTMGPSQLGVGNQIAVIDAGGGTVDCVSYELVTGTAQGANVEFKTIGLPSGSLCGSEFVNRTFLEWLKGRTSSFQTLCDNLGRTTMSVIKDACDQFEKFKLDFWGQSGETLDITLVGRPGAVLPIWFVTASNQDVKAFFDPVFREVMECIASQVNNKTRAIIVPGGFGNSRYLMDAIEQRWGNQLFVVARGNATMGTRQPVSSGALLRYFEISRRGVPSNTAFGIAQIEDYDPTAHPDATYTAGETKPSGRPARGSSLVSTMNPAIVDWDAIEGKWIVRERWVPILSKGTTIVAGEEIETRVWQQFRVTKYQGSVSIQVYWTQTDIRESAPIRIGKDADTNLHDGIEPWGPPVKVTLAGLKDTDFQLYDDDKKGQFYLIQVRILLKYDGSNIKVGFQIAEAGKEKYDEDGNERNGIVRMVRKGKKTIQLWDEDHNPSVRDTAS